MEERLQLLIPVGKGEAGLRRHLNTTEPLQLGTVDVGGGQMDETQTWSMSAPVKVGLFLVSTAVSPRSSLSELQDNFPGWGENLFFLSQ